MFSTPMQCMYDKARAGKHHLLPPHIQPFNRGRNIGFITLSGDLIRAAHIVGLDIRVPSDDGHSCGPFCGLRRDGGRQQALAALRRLSPWGRTAAETAQMLRTPRQLTFFWAGRMAHMHDERRLLWRHHKHRRGYLIKPTTADDNEADGWMAERMAASDFCGSPPGQNGGDSDRYLPAILYVCRRHSSQEPMGVRPS
jgi:hypothetical protein